MHASVTALKSLGTIAASADIRTSIDPRLQKLAARATAQTVAQFSDRGAAQAATIVVRLQDLSVAAWVGSTGFEASVDGSRINFAEVERSAGSTLKPFIYALALERGVLHPDTLLLDEPGPLRVANSDARYLGPMLPRQALANSLQCACRRGARAWRLSLDILVSRSLRVARRLALTVTLWRGISAWRATG